MPASATEVKAKTDLSELIRQTVELKEEGAYLAGLCPFHPDKTPSLKMRKGEANWKCYGCGKSGDVFAWVMERDSLDFKGALTYLANLKLSLNATAEPAQLPAKKRRKTKLWVDLPISEDHHYYKNLKGEVIGCLCRRIIEFKVKSKCVLYAKVPGGWQAGALPQDRPPYRWHDAAANPDAPLIIVEGENTADAVHKVGGVALSWAEGAQGVTRTNWTPLKGRKVIIVADADTEGRQAAIVLANRLYALGCKVSCRLPQGESGEDIRDVPGALESLQTAISWIQSHPMATIPAPYKGIGEVARKPSMWQNNEHWRVLGMHSGDVVIYQRMAKQVYYFSQKELYNASTLYIMNPDDKWWTDPETGGLAKASNIHRAANSILQAARQVGVYEQGTEMGRGSWKDAGGKVWWHMGNCILTPDGQEADLDEAPGRTCSVGLAIKVRPDASAGPKQANALWEATKGYQFATDADHTALMGWLVSAVICGALTWRSHLWLMSPSGTGKSWLLRNIVYPVIDALSKHRRKSGETSVPAFRRNIGSESLPFVLEEARRRSRKGALMFEDLLPIFRLASDGDAGISIAEGSGQRTTTVQPRCSVMLTSSVGHKLEEQDASRFTMMRLDLEKSDPKEWPHTARAIRLANAEPKKFVTSVMGAAETILYLIEQAHAHLTEKHAASARLADQLSTFAGAAAWAKSPGAPQDAIPGLCASLVQLSGDASNSASQDFWQHLLSLRLDVRNGGRMSVQNLLAESLVNPTAWERVTDFGIGIKDFQIGVNPHAPKLREALRESAWEGEDPKPLLLALPSAYQQPRNRPKWRLPTRCFPIILPLHLLGRGLKKPTRATEGK